MIDIWNLKRKQLEEIVTKLGFTDIRWCPADRSWWGKDTAEVLYAKPKDYKGPISDYEEPVAVEKVDGLKHSGYKWVKE